MSVNKLRVYGRSSQTSDTMELRIAAQQTDNKLVYLSKMTVLQEQPYRPKASWVNQPQDTQQVYNTSTFQKFYYMAVFNSKYCQTVLS